MLKLVGESTSAWGTRGQVGTAPFAQMALWMLMHGCFSYNPFKNLMMIHIRKSNHDILLVDNEKRLYRNLGGPYHLDIHIAHMSSSDQGKTSVWTRLFFLTACFPWPDFNAQALSDRSSVWVASGALSMLGDACLDLQTQSMNLGFIHQPLLFLVRQGSLGQKGQGTRQDLIPALTPGGAGSLRREGRRKEWRKGPTVILPSSLCHPHLPTEK